MNGSRVDVLMGVLVAGMAFLVTGCSTPGSQATPSAGGEEKAVTCDKCETVWARRPEHGGRGPVEYRRVKQMVCPDCQSAVVTFFKTGELAHTCRTCGGTLDHCVVHGEDIAPTATNAPAAVAQKERAVMCAKCQMVWVRRAEQINKTTVYRNVQVMRCPDCKSAVANFFTTGKWEHTCKTCGDNLSECAACK